jgi:nucleoid-associated protein YgaU
MKRYTTRKEDTIHRLSVLFFYRWDLWPLIYYTNKDVIGDDPLFITAGLTIKVPEPPVTDQEHVAVAGDTSMTLAQKYYGVRELFRTIDEANDCPPYLVSGKRYKIPALVDQIDIDAAKELRRETGVEFDK